jgi:hypothetical protein
MQASPDDNATDRPGRASFWTNSRFTHTVGGPDSEPGSTLPPAVGIHTLDDVRAAFWQAYRHLFPPHALAAQTGAGAIVISWSVADDPHALHPYAAPVVLRFDTGLLERMAQADADERSRLALQEEPTLR